MDEPRYPALDHLLSAYFHQDWCDEHSSEVGVLADFARTTWQKDVRDTITQIDQYLEEHKDGILSSFQTDFNPMVIIGDTDAEARCWLENVRDQLLTHLPLSPTGPAED